MKKLMFAVAILGVTGITALSAKDHTYSQNKAVNLQDTTRKDTTAKDTTSTPKDSTDKKQ